MTPHLLTEIAARRPGTVAAVIDRVSTDGARVRQHAASGALMTVSGAPTCRRLVGVYERAVDLNWRCAVLERFRCVDDVLRELSPSLWKICFNLPFLVGVTSLPLSPLPRS